VVKHSNGSLNCHICRAPKAVDDEGRLLYDGILFIGWVLINSSISIIVNTIKGIFIYPTIASYNPKNIVICRTVEHSLKFLALN